MNSSRFFDFIVENGGSPVIDWPRLRRLDSVLDVGSFDGLSLAVLYHDFGFQTLHGVDLRTEAQIVRELSERTGTQFSSLYEYYKIALTTGGEPRMTIAQFESRLRFEFGTDFFSSGGEVFGKYDLVVCSNVLHEMFYEQQVRHCLNRLKDSLEENGSVFISVKERPAGAVHRKFAMDAYDDMVEHVFGQSFEVGRISLTTEEEGTALVYTNLLLA